MPEQTVTILAVLKDALTAPLQKIDKGFVSLEQTLKRLEEKFKPIADSRVGSVDFQELVRLGIFQGNEPYIG